MANPFKAIENKIKKGINSLGDEIKAGINQLGNEIKNGLNQTGNEIRGGLNQTGKEISGGVWQLWKHLKGDLRTVGRDVQDAFEKEIPALAAKALKQAVEELERAITKQGLKLLRDGCKTAHRELNTLANDKPQLVDAINALGYSLKLGPMTLSYSGFYDRSENLASALDS